MKKGASKDIPVIMRAIPQSWGTSNGTFVMDKVGNIATHRAYIMSLPGGRGSTVNLAWRQPSKMAPILTMMLILTSPEIIANLPVQTPTYS
jgi:hypothetical protein